MRINVVYNKNILNSKDVLLDIESCLINKKIEFSTFELQEMSVFGDFTIVVGGDGTLIAAAKFYSQWKVPVLGINVGRLGFLSQVNNIDYVIDSILAEDFYIEERIMLNSLNKLALNDFVIKGCNSSRTSKFYLEIDGRDVCDYVADGLIISTPTGSTAYGLSAGGPILYPTVDAITIVPICPHTLNARPLVVPSSENIALKTCDDLLSVSIDGYEKENCIEKIEIKLAEKRAYLAFLNNENFYSILRNKLHWGISEARD